DRYLFGIRFHGVPFERLDAGQGRRVQPRPLVLYVMQRVVRRQGLAAALVEAGRVVLGVSVAVDARVVQSSVVGGHLVPPHVAERRWASMTRVRLLMRSVSGFPSRASSVSDALLVAHP